MNKVLITKKNVFTKIFELENFDFHTVIADFVKIEDAIEIKYDEEKIVLFYEKDSIEIFAKKHALDYLMECLQDKIISSFLIR